MMRYSFPIVLAATFSLVGCAEFSDLHSSIGRVDPGQLVAEKSLADVSTTALQPSEDWWELFGDLQLNDLVKEALKSSPTSQVALARVARAHAVVGLADAAGKPRFDLEFSADRELFSENYIFPPPLGGSYWNPGRLAGEFNYEFDFWGRDKARLAGALSQKQAAEADAAAARLMLATAVCHSYVELDHQLKIKDLIERLSAVRKEALRLVDLRVGAGLESQSAHQRFAAQLSSVNGQRAATAERIFSLRHQLSALLGAGPDRGLEINPPNLAYAGELALPSNLPADLIGRRPDVTALRARIEAMEKYAEVAKTDFFPNVNLVGFAGLQALDIHNLLNSGSKMMGLGPAIHLPLFDGGRLRQQLALRYAEQDGVVADYNQAVSEALREIADAVTRWRSLDLRQDEQRQATANLRAARDNAQRRYDTGLSDYLGVIGVESELITEEAREADLRAQRFDAAIELARAVGGGYVEDPKTNQRRILPD